MHLNIHEPTSSFFPLYPSRISQMNINSETILISSLIGPDDLSYADKISVNIGWIIDSSHAGRARGGEDVRSVNISNHVAPQKRRSPTILLYRREYIQPRCPTAFPNGHYIRISPTTLPCENRNKDIHRERYKALVIIFTNLCFWVQGPFLMYREGGKGLVKKKR